ncbi:hypothetical protein QQZ08_002551 [Neonectria magnoliae]|uniref:Uncharacterized protein n=1 Tax=Neonectria magnoliae TaxID=2732573 RepID=A0ABR1IBU4_9HYPO
MGFPELADRADLAARTVPKMALSNGSASSITPPPKATTLNDPIAGARDRFSVYGNMIVTGGVGGLGLASCDALLEHGLGGLMIFDVNPAQSQKEIDAMRSKFPQARIEAIKVDVTDEQAVLEAVVETVRSLGSVNGLVRFVGMVGCSNSLDVPVAQWRKIIDINTTGSFICAQAVARQMVRQNAGGSITFTASISANRVNYPPPQAAYNDIWTQFLNEGDYGARKMWASRNPVEEWVAHPS